MASWLRLEADFIDHPKIVSLTDQALRIHIRGLCYCAQHLTDGYIPAPLITNGNRRWIQELINAGLWQTTPQNHGYLIHDYLDYNPSRQELDDMKKRRHERGQRGANARWRTDQPPDGIR